MREAAVEEPGVALQVVDRAGVVTGAGQHLGQPGGLGRDRARGDDAGDPVAVIAEPGEQGGERRVRGDGGGEEVAVEDALLGQGGQSGAGPAAIAVAFQAVGTQGVDGDQDDVHAPRLLGLRVGPVG